MLHQMGATDLRARLGRATLQSKIDTARMLHEMLGDPKPPDGCLGGPAYTLSVVGHGTHARTRRPVVDDDGERLAPVDVVLETDSRKPGGQASDPRDVRQARSRVARYADDGASSRADRSPRSASAPRSGTCCVGRSRIEEIYPPELGCHDEVLATHGTPLAARRCCICASTTTSWRSRGGCSTAAWTSMRRRPSTPTASAATRRSSRPSFRSRISG